MNITEHLLFTLAEECAEVAQRASKAARFGMDEEQPGQGYSNRERISQELQDLWAVVEMLGLQQVDREAVERKKFKVKTFLAYAENECGTMSRTEQGNKRA